MEVTLDGERLTAAEIRELLAKSDGLALVRGRWVEVDRERLSRMLEHFREVERTAAENGLGFREAMRLLAGADVAAGDASADADAEWSQVVAGPWLARDAERAPQPGGIGPNRPRRCPERHAAALPAGGRALALSPREARSGGLPGR